MAATHHVLLAGGSGLIGAALADRLRTEGHRVTRLVRRDTASADEVRWDARSLDPTVLEGVDAVINLSGATVGRIPWTTRYRRTLVSSRVEPTRALAEAIVAAATPPKVFISGSAVGFYGNRPGETVSDGSERGDGFFPDLVTAWEQASAIAAGATRVVNIRTAVVVAHGGGLAPIRILTKLGLGARFSTGEQYWPWIGLRDQVRAIIHLLDSELAGPVVLAGPTPATSFAVTYAYAREMGRPHRFVVPRFAIRLLGEAGQRLLLDDLRVLPRRLQADGFEWTTRTIDRAVAAIDPEDRAD
ncbi:MAG TPA: TIGR01777 family oxidoreductase [Pseudolysinimonas sp.]|nr:TIGR01777 family oxidoreductase [Pseudolysinimonas sp.]